MRVYSISDIIMCVLDLAMRLSSSGQRLISSKMEVWPCMFWWDDLALHSLIVGCHMLSLCKSSAARGSYVYHVEGTQKRQRCNDILACVEYHSL